MIRIDVDVRSGFCTGVIKAVNAAENYLGDHEKLQSLGELVHNPEEVNRLKGVGLDSISYEEFDKLRDTTVLIRAHGEPPETFLKAGEQNIRLIDATCPIVRNLQKKIRDTYSASRGKEGSILIYGKSSHPEVRALLGQTEGNAVVMRDPGELSFLKLKSPLFLFSQTTMNPNEYLQFQEVLKTRMKDAGMNPDEDLQVHNTVCPQVSNREDYLKEFVTHYDLVLFISGRKSSNGKALYDICKEVNPNTIFISNPEESDSNDLEGIKSIGICGATSTPGWLLEAVKGRLENRINRTGI